MRKSNMTNDFKTKSILRQHTAAMRNGGAVGFPGTSNYGIDTRGDAGNNVHGQNRYPTKTSQVQFLASGGMVATGATVPQDKTLAPYTATYDSATGRGAPVAAPPRPVLSLKRGNNMPNALGHVTGMADGGQYTERRALIGEPGQYVDEYGVEDAIQNPAYKEYHDSITQPAQTGRSALRGAELRHGMADGGEFYPYVKGPKLHEDGGIPVYKERGDLIEQGDHDGRYALGGAELRHMADGGGLQYTQEPQQRQKFNLDPTGGDGTSNFPPRYRNGGYLDQPGIPGVYGYMDGGQPHPMAYIDGGDVSGPKGIDKIGPTMLMDGEYVLPKDTVDQVGKRNLDRLKDATHTPIRVQHKGALRSRGHADGGDIDWTKLSTGFRDDMAPLQDVRARAMPRPVPPTVSPHATLSSPGQPNPLLHQSSDGQGLTSVLRRSVASPVSDAERSMYKGRDPNAMQMYGAGRTARPSMRSDMIASLYADGGAVKDKEPDDDFDDYLFTSGARMADGGYMDGVLPHGHRHDTLPPEPYDHMMMADGGYMAGVLPHGRGGKYNQTGGPGGSAMADGGKYNINLDPEDMDEGLNQVGHSEYVEYQTHRQPHLNVEGHADGGRYEEHVGVPESHEDSEFPTVNIKSPGALRASLKKMADGGALNEQSFRAPPSGYADGSIVVNTAFDTQNPLPIDKKIAKSEGFVSATPAIPNVPESSVIPHNNAPTDAQRKANGGVTQFSPNTSNFASRAATARDAAERTAVGSSVSQPAVAPVRPILNPYVHAAPSLQNAAPDVQSGDPMPMGAYRTQRKANGGSVLRGYAAGGAFDPEEPVLPAGPVPEQWGGEGRFVGETDRVSSPANPRYETPGGRAAVSGAPVQEGASALRNVGPGGTVSTVPSMFEKDTQDLNRFIQGHIAAGDYEKARQAVATPAQFNMVEQGIADAKRQRGTDADLTHLLPGRRAELATQRRGQDITQQDMRERLAAETRGRELALAQAHQQFGVTSQQRASELALNAARLRGEFGGGVLGEGGGGAGDEYAPGGKVGAELSMKKQETSKADLDQRVQGMFSPDGKTRDQAQEEGFKNLLYSEFSKSPSDFHSKPREVQNELLSKAKTAYDIKQAGEAADQSRMFGTPTVSTRSQPQVSAHETPTLADIAAGMGPGAALRGNLYPLIGKSGEVVVDALGRPRLRRDLTAAPGGGRSQEQEDLIAAQLRQSALRRSQ